LVSSHSFPHLWKKLWKLAKNPHVSAVLALFAGVREEAKPGERRNIGVSDDWRRGNPREISPPTSAKPW
jgi:hypothetical protein